jgi:RNA polymerase sigma-70 factor, ECF subfamily
LVVHHRADRSRADVALLDRIIARDQQALGELYDSYSRLLFGLIVRILRNRGEAEDVLQDVFVQVWLRASTYRPAAGTPAGWLVTIARNRAIDRLRANAARGPIVGLEPLAMLMTVEREDRESEFGEQIAIQRALDALPAEQRDLIEQAFFLGFTHAELAVRFNLPLGTVKTRMRVAIQTLRTHFEAALIER